MNWAVDIIVAVIGNSFLDPNFMTDPMYILNQVIPVCCYQFVQGILIIWRFIIFSLWHANLTAFNVDFCSTSRDIPVGIPEWLVLSLSSFEKCYSQRSGISNSR